MLFSHEVNSQTSLVYLHLEYNQISKIDSQTFNGLTNLIEQYLNDNQISTVDRQGFNELNSLVFLYLYNNRINTIDSQMFNELTSLQWLDLSINQITTLPASVFSALYNSIPVYNSIQFVLVKVATIYLTQQYCSESMQSFLLKSLLLLLFSQLLAFHKIILWL